MKKMWFAPDSCQVCETPMWHSETIGICIQHGQVSQTWKHCWIQMTGMLLWLCQIKVEQYMLGCWMGECISLKYVLTGMWWPPKMVQKVYNMDHGGLMRWNIWKIWIDIEQNDFSCCKARSLQLTWWNLFVNWLQLWLQIFGGYEKCNLWDMSLEGRGEVTWPTSHVFPQPLLSLTLKLCSNVVFKSPWHPWTFFFVF